MQLSLGEARQEGKGSKGNWINTVVRPWRKSYGWGQGLMQVELPDTPHKSKQNKLGEGGAGPGVGGAPASPDLALPWAAAFTNTGSGLPKPWGLAAGL